MNNINFLYLMDQIDDKYIVEAKMLPRPKREFLATSRLTSFFSDAMTVAATIIVFGALIIWSLVGKDLLTKDQGYDTTPTDAVTTPIVTTEPDKEPDDPIVYSKGLRFELNEDNDGYSVIGIGTCKDTVINIPPTYNGLPVTEIGKYAFGFRLDIVEVNIPNCITIIGQEAFLGCTKLEKVTIPNSVKIIGQEAFSGCSAIKNITLPNSITEIHNYAFAKCYNLIEITIPNGVTSIYGLFSECNALKKVELPSSLELIGDEVFTCCRSLETVNIPESVTEIGEYTFLDCQNLKKIVIPKNVICIGSQAFIGCTELTIYCEADKQPKDWDSIWNLDKCPVVWGYTGNYS